VILVAGGSGRLGTLVVKDLAATGHRVRVLSRWPARLTDLGATGVEVASGDVRDPESLTEPMNGVRTVVSAVHGFDGSGGVTPASVDRDGNRHLVAAAARAGADVVLVSVVGAAAQHRMELFRMKWSAEQALMSSGVPWTVVRSSAFAETWVDILVQTAGRSGRPVVLGRGQNPVNFVAVQDVAGAVVRAVDDTSLRGTVLEVGGPENLTHSDLAERVQRARGWTGRPRHVPRPALRVAAAALIGIHPRSARRAAAALAMDTLAFSYDPSAARERHPWLPCTDVSGVGAGPS